MARFHVFSLRRVRARTTLILKVFLLLVLLGLLLPRALAFLTHQVLPSLAPLWGAIKAPASSSAPPIVTPGVPGKTSGSAGVPSQSATSSTTSSVGAAPKTPVNGTTPVTGTTVQAPATTGTTVKAPTGMSAQPRTAGTPLKAEKTPPFLTLWFHNFVAALQAFYQGGR